MTRLILDFDGTLVDIEECWIKFFKGIAKVVKSNGSYLSINEIFRVVEDEFLHSGMDFFDKRFPHEDVVTKICKRCGVSFSKKIFEEYKKEIEKFLELIPPLRTGIRKVLRNKNYKVFIVSDVPKKLILNVLKNEEIKVDGILTQEDFGTKDKKVLYKHALDPREINIILGDRLDNDIKPANELKDLFPNTEIVTVWYPYNARVLKWYKVKSQRKPEDEIEKPDFTVDEDTLESILKKL